MKKIQIINLAAAGLLSFAAVFTVSFMIKKNQVVLPEVDPGKAMSEEGDDMFGEPDFTVSTGSGDVESYSLSKSMTEKQLKSLIYDIREKMAETRFTEKQLEMQEERIQTLREVMQEDIERMEKLRLQLTSVIANLAQQEHNLLQTIIKIDDLEKTNMQTLALRYEKMKPDMASDIMVNMAKNNQIKDAVMIIHYMSEAKSGKLLGTIAGTKPDLAASISLMLKKVQEGK
ncbi:MAG: hypothetical protein KAR47_19920 [Planctomycetes bacterium]|nr:hypothetical protein [Planctomycetota bacterium]